MEWTTFVDEALASLSGADQLIVRALANASLAVLSQLPSPSDENDAKHTVELAIKLAKSAIPIFANSAGDGVLYGDAGWQPLHRLVDLLTAADRRISGAENVADVTQSALLRLIAELDRKGMVTFRDVNRAIDAARKANAAGRKTQQLDSDLVEILSQRPSAEQQAINDEIVGYMEEVLNQIPWGEHALYYLRSEITWVELAEELGLPFGTVYGGCRQALDTLRRKLRQRFPE